MHTITETCAVSSCHRGVDGLKRIPTARGCSCQLRACKTNLLNMHERFTSLKISWDLDSTKTIILENTFLRSGDWSFNAVPAGDPSPAYQEGLTRTVSSQQYGLDRHATALRYHDSKQCLLCSKYSTEPAFTTLFSVTQNLGWNREAA